MHVCRLLGLSLVLHSHTVQDPRMGNGDAHCGLDLLTVPQRHAHRPTQRRQSLTEVSYQVILDCVKLTIKHTAVICGNNARVSLVCLVSGWRTKECWCGLETNRC